MQVLHIESTITRPFKEYCLEVISRLRKAIHQKLRDLWKNQSWILHHDNATVHTSILVRKFLAKNKTIIRPQPQHSPDLAFPELKTAVKEKYFTTIEELNAKSKKELMAIQKTCFRIVSRVGKNAGISGFNLKGT